MIAFRKSLDEFCMPNALPIWSDARKLAAAFIREARNDGMTRHFGVKPVATLHGAFVYSRAKYADEKRGTVLYATIILQQIFIAQDDADKAHRQFRHYR